MGRSGGRADPAEYGEGCPDGAGSARKWRGARQACARAPGVLMSTIEYVWAVDPAVSRLAFAFAPLGAAPVIVETLHIDSEAREGRRLGLLDRQVRIAAGQWAVDYPPAVVWVEQPSGRYRNLPLTYAVGVVMAALSEALACPVWTMPSSAWKKRTVGCGNASKAQVARWVAARGADLASQDEADAYALSEAGRAMVRAGAWDATAAAAGTPGTAARRGASCR